MRNKIPTLDDEAEEENNNLSSRLIYGVIRQEGREELARPTGSLFWSAVAAGIMISFSVVGEAIFRTYLPDTPARFLIENLGYSLGFLLVILGRMQLFTENTIVTVLPFMTRPTGQMAGRILRLWGIVLSANVIGAFFIALIFVHTPALPETLTPAMMDLSRHATGMGAADGFFRAIPAGLLIAALVWMLPQARQAGFFVIIVLTWLIAAGDFTHIIAGSVEMAYLMVQGQLGVLEATLGFFLPVLAGNIVGGTLIFALMAWGQVRDEVGDDDA